MERIGLILLAHGSPDPRWRAPFEALLDRLRRQHGEDKCWLGFLEFAQPDLATAAAAAAGAGLQRVRILPLFMAGGGGHVSRDIPKRVAGLCSRYPQLVWEILPVAGEDPRVATALCEVALEALGGK